MASIPMGRAVAAGLIAGIVFVNMEMVLVSTTGGDSAWGPPRMMGAIVLGKDVLPPPATFDAAIVAVGLIVHFTLSAVLGIIFVIATAPLNLARAMLIATGALFGLIVYLVNFYGFTAIFPWFAMARNWITILSHLVFGVVLAGWLAATPAKAPAT